MRTVLTIGTFDIPHMGHATFLKRASRYGDLVVGVNSDRFVTEYKGKPSFTYRERCALVRQFGFATIENDGPGRDLIEQIQPRVLVIGSDWLGKDYFDQTNTSPDFFTDNNIELVYIPYTEGISSTVIRDRVRG